MLSKLKGIFHSKRQRPFADKEVSDLTVKELYRAIHLGKKVTTFDYYELYRELKKRRRQEDAVNDR
jgi:hypothetical protein